MGDNLPTVSLGTGAETVSLAASDSSTCAVLSGGSVKCWGDNTYGQLGQGDTVDIGLADGSMGDAFVPVDFGAGLNLVSLTSGNSHSCVQFANSQIKCWGYNLFGGLGLGDTVNRGDLPGEMGDKPSVCFLLVVLHPSPKPQPGVWCAPWPRIKLS